MLKFKSFLKTKSLRAIFLIQLTTLFFACNHMGEKHSEASETIASFMENLKQISKYSEIESLYETFNEWSAEQLKIGSLSKSDLEKPYDSFCKAADALAAKAHNPKTVVVSVKLQVTDENTSDFINEKLLATTKLKGSHNYHVTLGVIENVLVPCTKDVEYDVKNFFKAKFPDLLKTSNFTAHFASTFEFLGSKIYSGKSVLLLTRNTDLFKQLNLALVQFVEAKNTETKFDFYLDWNTVPKRFIPHISLRTPQSKETPAQPKYSAIKPAMELINNRLENAPLEIPLNELKVSTHPHNFFKNHGRRD
jgi:hypothetical protein